MAIKIKKSNMKNIVIILLVILASCSSQTPEQKAAKTQNNQDLLNLISKEKKVLDATITDANVLYVSVKSDGTNRNGYAEYFCQLIKSVNSDIRWVKVVEAGTSKSPNADNAYGELLGESHCEFLDK
jgi:hypothetical protein